MTSQLRLGARRLDAARFSECGRFRFTLSRELGGDRPAVFCAINPSGANAAKNDQTAHKFVGFTKILNCGRAFVVNAYAYIATDMDDMWRAKASGIDIVGSGNDASIREAIDLCLLNDGVFVVCWGGKIEPARQAEIDRLIRLSGVTPMCFGSNGDGTPKHLLYRAYAAELVPWSCP